MELDREEEIWLIHDKEYYADDIEDYINFVNELIKIESGVKEEYEFDYIACDGGVTHVCDM